MISVFVSLLLTLSLRTTAAQESNVSRFSGVEYAAQAPDGIKFERGVALSEQEYLSPHDFVIKRGRLGDRVVLWTQKLVDRGLHSRYRVVDILEIRKPKTGEEFAETCFPRRGPLRGSNRSGMMGIISTAMKRTPKSAAAPTTINAWGIDSKTGNIVVLRPSEVECVSEGDTGD